MRYEHERSDDNTLSHKPYSLESHATDALEDLEFFKEACQMFWFCVGTALPSSLPWRRPKALGLTYPGALAAAYMLSGLGRIVLHFETGVAELKHVDY